MSTEQWRVQATDALIMAAGELHKALGNDINTPMEPVEQWVVQSRGFTGWRDSPSEWYPTEAEARERAAEIAPWDHVRGSRVIRRRVLVDERPVAAYGPDGAEERIIYGSTFMERGRIRVAIEELAEVDRRLRYSGQRLACRPFTEMDTPEGRAELARHDELTHRRDDLILTLARLVGLIDH